MWSERPRYASLISRPRLSDSNEMHRFSFSKFYLYVLFWFVKELLESAECNDISLGLFLVNLVEPVLHPKVCSCVESTKECWSDKQAFCILLLIVAKDWHLKHETLVHICNIYYRVLENCAKLLEIPHKWHSNLFCTRELVDNCDWLVDWARQVNTHWCW